MDILSSLSERALTAPESGIVEVVNYARGRPGLIPLWVGEGDEPTPDFINQAAISALTAGETFYTWQRGIPELRQALSRYYTRHFQTSLPYDNFYVTGSGMQAIRIAVEAITGPGDEMIYLSPAWPNIVSALELSGARAVSMPLDYIEGRWSLDLERLQTMITPRTKGLFINSPSNPTGWTASSSELSALLDLSRRHNIWILADEIYALYFYESERAPSFLDLMQADDRVILVNSFSKNWAMTGWRVGWLVAPPELGQVIENLIQYSTSGVAQFLQKGAVAALDHGDAFVAANKAKAARARDILCDALIATNRVATLKPDGAFYAFLRIDGVRDSRKAAIEIVDKCGVGLAPGSAFGQSGETFLRACFLRDGKSIEEAADRLSAAIPFL